MNLIERALQQLDQAIARATRICVAYSGGVDSHVLLHAISQYCQKPILAIHVHHGLQIAADDWVIHCQSQAQQLQVQCTILYVDAKPSGRQSPEEAARTARYAAIQQQLQAGDLLLTAHNQDDQAETVLLQLFRGAGPKGLSAMPAQMDFPPAILCRPLLSVSRREIENYAREHKLQWVEDPTNLSTHYDRNYLRQEILPLLTQRWPIISTVLARSAQLQAEASTLLSELAEIDIKPLYGSQPDTLSINALLQLTSERQRNVIRYWLHNLQLPTPTHQQLAILLTEVILAEVDKNPLLHWPGVEVRRYRDDLYAMSPLADFDSSLCINWDRSAPLTLAHELGVLLPDHPSLPKDRQPVTIRFRQGGEECKIPNRQGTHSLKHLLQEWGVPPWQRDRIPLIYRGEELLSVYGYSQPLS